MNYRSLLLVSLFILPNVSFAYGVNTHYKLTEQAGKEYRRLGGTLPLTTGDIAALASGAVDEDEIRTNPLSGDLGTQRPLNHFFDPINQRGLTLGGYSSLSSPQWAIDTLAQATYGISYTHSANEKLFESAGDFSWDRAVYDYVHGDKRRALSALGHVMHLLEDATSPAHTRNDAHSGNWDGFDPYEMYTENLIPSTVVSSVHVPYFTKADDAIRVTALFTNTNFFSRDTIDDFVLPRKTNLNIKDIRGVQYGLRNGNVLIKVKNTVDKNTFEESIEYTYPNDDITILSSNWSALSQKAVTNGVGLIRLFERAVEEERQTGALAKRNVSALQLLAQSDARKIATALTFGTPSTGAQTAAVSNTQTPPALLFPTLADSLAADTLAAQDTAAQEHITPAPSTTSRAVSSMVQSAQKVVEILPERIAFTQGTGVVTALETPSSTLPPSTSLPSTVLGTGSTNLQPLTYGAGQGGGGTSTALSAESPAAQVTTTPVCTPPQILEVTSNTCVTPPPVCAPNQTLDTTTNTCIPSTSPLPDTFTDNTILDPLITYTSREEQTITIPTGVTLTIPEGTTLSLAGKTRIVVEGTLVATGTDTAPVVITAVDTSAPWHGISVRDGAKLSLAHTNLSWSSYTIFITPEEEKSTINNFGITTLDHVTISHTTWSASAHWGGSFTSSHLVVHDGGFAFNMQSSHFTLTNTHVARTLGVGGLNNLNGTVTGTTTEDVASNFIFLDITRVMNTNARLLANNVAYMTVSPMTVAYGTLLIEPGVVVQNARDGMWYVGGGGTAASLDPTAPNQPLFTNLWDSDPRATADPEDFGNVQFVTDPALQTWYGFRTFDASSFVDPRFIVRGI